MESKALTGYKTPDYPRKEDVQSQPSLLRKSVDKRWRKLYDRGISGMLVASLSLSGCDDKPTTTTNQNIEATFDQNSNASQTNNASPAKLAALVAPIFEHGEGRGSIGCVAVAPPAFISEDEALVVIREEFKRHGIKLDKEKVILENVMIAHGKDEQMAAIRKMIADGESEMAALIQAETEKVEPLEIDLADSHNNINIEFVSKEDFLKFGGTRSASTVQDYDFKRIAEEVRKEIQLNVKSGIYGIFYEPIIPFGNSQSINYKDSKSVIEQLENMRNDTIESSKEELRNQVNDFAKWLKEQGVIE